MYVSEDGYLEKVTKILVHFHQILFIPLDSIMMQLLLLVINTNQRIFLSIANVPTNIRDKALILHISYLLFSQTVCQ